MFSLAYNFLTFKSNFLSLFKIKKMKICIKTIMKLKFLKHVFV